MLNRSEDKTIHLTLKNDELTIQPSTPESEDASSEMNESTQATIRLPPFSELRGKS